MKKAKKDKAKKPELLEIPEELSYTERPEVEVEELLCDDALNDCFIDGEIEYGKNVISIEKLF